MMMTFKPYFRRAEAGFTLAETAIIVMVMGLIIGPLFHFLAADYLRKQRAEQSREHDLILAAISSFYADAGRYPCPADPTVAMNSADYGQEHCNAVGSGAIVNGIRAFNARVDNAAVPGVSQIYIGALPTAVLGLPAEAAVNQDGWKYFYVVSGDLMNAGVPNATGSITVWVDSNNNGVTGLDAGGNPIDGADISSDLVQFVLIDPGKDGKGARSLDGGVGVNLCNVAAAGDYRNCSFTLDGITASEFRDVGYASLSNINSPNHFDDVVLYNQTNQETTFWQIDNPTLGGDMNISARGGGNVGIGTNNPSASLHIVGGDVKVNGVDANGRSIVNTQEMILLGDDQGNGGVVDAPSNVDAGNMLGSSSGFYYPN